MKRKLWFLMAEMDRQGVQAVVPAVAWMAEVSGVSFECYLESFRDGRLFARTGSTVLGGRHHQQFNYLNSVFDIEYILYGDPVVFRSSLEPFGARMIASGDTPGIVYRQIMEHNPNLSIHSVSIIPDGHVLPEPEGVELVKTTGPEVHDSTLEISPYLYNDIFRNRAAGFVDSQVVEACTFGSTHGIGNCSGFFLKPVVASRLREAFPEFEEVDRLLPGDTYGSVSVRAADRWKEEAAGVAFGDPAAILSQLPRLCREKRVAIYGEKDLIPPAEVEVSHYTEECTSILDDVYRLCKETGNPVMVGRQTGDGDLFVWSRRGIALQIMDPNRPVFPVVETVEHRWASTDSGWDASEPDDETLRCYAEEGKVLASLIWHSGEMAHNEAMLSLVELSVWTGVKMGIGVHWARYSTAPQLWELINVPVENGGAMGLIEPILHSGGMGVMVEAETPPEILKAHCTEAMKRIEQTTGTSQALTKGYYAFMDSDMVSFLTVRPDLFTAVSECGLEYFISNAFPGRNRILFDDGSLIALNQTSRSIATGSPYVRITDVEDLKHYSPATRPGWMIGTLDAPVIAFNPYIWREGTRFMKIVDFLTKTPWVVNVTPHVVARYAKILKSMGYLNGGLE